MEANNKQPMTATQFIETKGIALSTCIEGYVDNSVKPFYLDSLLEEYKQQSSVQPGMSFNDLLNSCATNYMFNEFDSEEENLQTFKSFFGFINDMAKQVEPLEEMYKEAAELYAQSCVAKAVEEKDREMQAKLDNVWANRNSKIESLTLKLQALEGKEKVEGEYPIDEQDFINSKSHLFNPAQVEEIAKWIQEYKEQVKEFDKIKLNKRTEELEAQLKEKDKEIEEAKSDKAELEEELVPIIAELEKRLESYPVYITDEQIEDIEKEYVHKMNDGDIIYDPGFKIGMETMRSKIFEGNNNGWISVQDRLPEEDQRVIAIGKHNTPVIDYWNNDKNSMGLFQTYGNFKMSYTHWMPLLPSPNKL